MKQKNLSQSNIERRKNSRRNKLKVVCLQDVLLDLMNDWKIQMVDIQKATNIPWATLQDWIVNGKTPMLDGNMLALSKYFNCSINYLAFGIGEEPLKPDSESNKAA